MVHNYHKLYLALNNAIFLYLVIAFQELVMLLYVETKLTARTKSRHASSAIDNSAFILARVA